MHTESGVQRAILTRGRRGLIRAAAIVVAAFMCVGVAGSAAATGAGSPLGRPAGLGALASADPACPNPTVAPSDSAVPPTKKPVSRVSARGTLPHTGGRSWPTLLVGAGLLGGGLLLLVVAHGLRRRGEAR